MHTADIRQRWLDFFAERGHTVVPSASLVSDDPTLLFTVAGMVPFVPYLTGLVPPPYKRATSVQKCIRTLDIEEVGKTPRHGTFFQMNGNFSFGDYFKEEAIGFAWELLTSPESAGGYGFDAQDLWVTVYKDDNEAAELWRTIAGLPEERIQRLGMDTNYWSTGLPGPAGPCSEIFFDRGPAYGRDGGPATDDDRYVEIWNLVFMQYLRGEADAQTPTLVRVHMQNPLADALHWRRADFGPAVGEVLATIAREGGGALVLLGEAVTAESLLERIRSEPGRDPEAPAGGALAEWRRNGAGAQILADLGLGKLRVLGTPRRQVGLAGYGLDVVEYVH